MKSNRPVNLKLSTLAFPPMAIASILHRISGILLFVFLPFVLYVLHQSLLSQQTFLQLQMCSCHLYKIAVWAFGTSLIYHVIAGIRHILSDMNFGDQLPLARSTANGAIGLSVILSLFLGMLLW